MLEKFKRRNETLLRTDSKNEKADEQFKPKMAAFIHKIILISLAMNLLIYILIKNNSPQLDKIYAYTERVKTTLNYFNFTAQNDEMMLYNQEFNPLLNSVMIIKTFNRPMCLIKQIKSLLDYAPYQDLLIADDSFPEFKINASFLTKYFPDYQGRITVLNHFTASHVLCIRI